MTTSQDSNFDVSDLKRNLSDCNSLHGAVGSLNPRPPGLHNSLIQFAKKLMRRGLSWYTRPLHQFQGAVTRTLNDLAVAVENVELSWRQNIPAFLNAVSTVNAFGHELGRLRRELEQVRQEARQEIEQGLQSGRHEASQNLEQGLTSLRGILQQTNDSVVAAWERIEFTRCEMLFEMKYGRQTSGLSAVAAELNHVEPKIVSLKKVASARRLGLKLNLGCGHLPLEGYVNVDRRELPGVDVVADVGDLCFDEESVQEIFSAHLLEHFPQEMLRRRLLPTWRKLLTPDGIFRAVVPDGEAMLAGIAAGTYSFSNFREVLFGAQDYDGDFHFNLFTPDSLCGLLVEAGFAGICVNAHARPNGKCFEFEVSATKPSIDRVASKPSSSKTVGLE